MNVKTLRCNSMQTQSVRTMKTLGRNGCIEFASGTIPGKNERRWGVQFLKIRVPVRADPIVNTQQVIDHTAPTEFEKTCHG